MPAIANSINHSGLGQGLVEKRQSFVERRDRGLRTFAFWNVLRLTYVEKSRPVWSDAGRYVSLRIAVPLFAIAGVMGCSPVAYNASGPNINASSPNIDASGPNILLISVDDMNGWIEPLNDASRRKPAIYTPNIQRLASKGILYTNAHTPVPACTAARASIVTGVYPRNDNWIIQAYKDRQFTGLTTLADHLKAHGYTTLMAGKVFPPMEDSAHWDSYEHFPRSLEEKVGETRLNGVAGLPGHDPLDWGERGYELQEMSLVSG